ncbi:hypothetical protein A2U01_0113126, partial [Trifolium medium]|nr:hypothetical protein [Trifolium medium]
MFFVTHFFVCFSLILGYIARKSGVMEVKGDVLTSVLWP